MTNYAIIHTDQSGELSAIKIFAGWDSNAVRKALLGFNVFPEIGETFAFVSEGEFSVCEAVQVHDGDERNFPASLNVEMDANQIATITVVHGDVANPERNLTPQIEAERQRRIYLVATQDQQAAAYRKSIALLHKGEANWDADDQAVVDRFEAANLAIEAITIAADTLIAMDQQPANFADDSYWPNLGA